MKLVTIERKILDKNDQIATENRRRFKSLGLRTLNLISSPGAGKTTVLEKTLEMLAGRLRVAVIEGDLQTDRDARRIDRYHVPVVQIVTNGGCHLEANLVREAAASLDLSASDLLIIENVGNLVCPAGFDLGEDMKVVLFSTPEGEDKPLKYPKIFRNAEVCLINKIDLLPYLDFDLDQAINHVRSIHPDIKIFTVSARSGEGMAEWIGWIEKFAAQKMMDVSE